MYTIIEMPTFSRATEGILTDDEIEQFCVYLANNPLSGTKVVGSGGYRKIRWYVQNLGKRGGIRVIYYNQLNDGIINLLFVYTKAKTETIPSYLLKQWKEELNYV